MRKHLKIISIYFPNLLKTVNSQTQKVPQSQIQIKGKRKKKTPIPKHVTIKSLKTSDKEKNHKSSHRKKIYANEQSLGL